MTLLFERTRLLVSAENADGLTVIALEETWRDPSLAVIKRLPAVLRVMGKDPEPLTSVAEFGMAAAGSEEENSTDEEWSVTRLPAASSARTVTLKELPAVTLAGTSDKTRFVAAPWFTVIGEEVTEMLPLEAWMVCSPAVLRVTWKDPTPETRDAEAGSVAEESEDEMETEPENAGARFMFASLAWTENVKDCPEMEEEGMLLKMNCDA